MIFKVRTYEFQVGEDRKSLQEVVNASFGLLELFVQKLLTHYDELPSAATMRLILKIFFAAINV